MQEFIKKHPEFCALSLLTFLCAFFLFFGIDFYPILDNSEAMFASISKNIFATDDFKILMLNMQPFLDKPPLYFWLIAKSMQLFNMCNELSIRLPNAIISLIFVFFTYFMGKNLVSRLFGVTSSIILLTSLSYLLLSHIAILTIAFSFLLTSALYFGFYASIQEEKSSKTKYFWWAFYLFCAIACLVKGLIGIILPLLILIIYNIFSKNLKSMFKPINFLVGMLIFLPITLPWYYEMYVLFGSSFVKNYIYIPHFKLLFKNLIYYLLLFIPAFMPWSFIFIGYVLNTIKTVIARLKNSTRFSLITLEQKLNFFCLTSFVLILLYISLSEKSIYSLLLLIPSATILTTYFLCGTDINELFKKKVVSFSTYTLATFFTVSTISLAFFYMFLPLNLYEHVQKFKNFVIIGINFASILMLLKLKNKSVLSTLTTYVFSMFFIIVFTVVHGFNMFYFSGENELVTYAKYATNKNIKLITYNLPVKPSILMESSDYVYFVQSGEVKELNKLLEDNRKDLSYLILRNKDIQKTLDKIDSKIYLVDSGDKYSLFSNIELPKKAISMSKFFNEQ